MFIVHRFRYNELFMFAGNDVMAISSLGSASGNFWWRSLKGRPRLYIHDQLELFVYLERFRRYSTFFIWLWFPYWGQNCWGFWAEWPPKRQNSEKHLLGGHFLTSNCVFWAIVRQIISIRLIYAGAQEKKTGRKEERKEEKSQEVYISRMCGATPSGRIPTKLGKCVYITKIIKLAKFHRYKCRGFGAVRCSNFYVAIGNSGRP